MERSRVSPVEAMEHFKTRGVIQIKASLRSSHFGALGQRPTPTTGHTLPHGYAAS
jgi:hypothetical protein